MGKMWDGGREREGIDPAEYWDRRFREAYDMGLGRVLLREGVGAAGGEVIRGCREGWFEFWVGLVADGDATTGGEVAGDEPLCDITAVILSGRRGGKGDGQPACAPQTLVM